MIVSQDRAEAELYQRTDEGWERMLFLKADDEISLKSIGVTFTLADIYRSIHF